MRSNRALRSRSGFTLIELLVVISVIVILATIAITALAGVMGQQQQKNAVATLKIIDSSINSYHKLYGHWPIDPALQPPTLNEAAINALPDGIPGSDLNKNILKNLKHDWGQGNFNSFPEDAVKVDPGDGLEYLVDPWQVAYEFKVKVVTKGGKPVITVLYFYSAGEDHLDDFAELQTWLATPGASWPPQDTFQNDLRLNTPSSKNVDNVYPSPD